MHFPCELVLLLRTSIVHTSFEIMSMTMLLCSMVTLTEQFAHATLWFVVLYVRHRYRDKQMRLGWMYVHFALLGEQPVPWTHWKLLSFM